MAKIRMTDGDWSRNLWNRIRTILTGHEQRIEALEQGGGGGGGAVSGVKGDAESTYRTGNVNLTPANIGALPNSTVIPSKTSDLTNDSGFITTETDPTVPSWAKQSTKPTYTASEVGAVATSDIANNLTTTAAGKVLDARQGKVLDAKAEEIRFNSSVATWADVYDALSALVLYKSAPFSSAQVVSSLLTGGELSNTTMRGAVCQTLSGTYDFFASSGTGNQAYAWRISGLTSASATPTVGTVYRYYGATSAANLKETLGLGTEIQDFRLSLPTALGTNQAFGISAIVSNTKYPSRNGHRVTFAPGENELLLWDNTNSEAILRIDDTWAHKADTDFTDWDDFKPKVSSSSFRVGRTSGGNGTHAPFSGYTATWYGMLFGAGVYFSQVLICTYATDSKLLGRIFTRACVNGTFTAWQAVQMSGGGWLPSGTDIDTIVTPGTYGLSANNTYSGLPTGVTSGILTVVNPSTATTYCIQRIDRGSTVYIRYRSASSGTAFGSWYKYTGTAV